MFLTDNLPRPKYDSGATPSIYPGSDNEHKTYSKTQLDKAKHSKRKIMNNNENFILPNIKAKNNIIDKLREKDRQRKRPGEINDISVPRK